MWKVRPENLQDEYGKLAPRVTKHPESNSCINQGGPPTATPCVVQDAWLGAALEELAQMCGGFLGATAYSTPNTSSPLVARLNIKIHVGDALNFCDALLAASSAVGLKGDDAANDTGTAHPGGTVTSPVAFQQGTLQPLHLRADIFGGLAPAFDVIKTSNLADHLGRLHEAVRIQIEHHRQDGGGQ